MKNESSLSRGLVIFLILSVGTFPFAAFTWADPYEPSSDSQILERLFAQKIPPALRETRKLRAELSRRPGDLDLALALAQRYLALARAEGDPRYAGYAQ